MPAALKRLPTAEQPAVRCAKIAIQKLLLSPEDPELRKMALRAIKNADDMCGTGGRQYWRGDMLIVPHNSLFERDWYCNHWKQERWSIDTMPAWAYSGKLEPKLGELILGRAYTVPPK